MPHDLRKTRKRRGSRTVGYGRVGQHRDQGSKGFRRSGRHKKGWSWVQRYDPDYYGKNGFTSPSSLRLKANIVNVGMLDQMAGETPAEKEKGRLFVDLEHLGFTKLLGSGRITKALSVKVASCSSRAAEKIQEAGGEVLMATQKEGE